MSIQVKRGLAINLPTLKEGELGFTTDSYEVYIGSDNGNVLLNNGEVLIRRSNGYLQYAYANRKNQWFNICSLDEIKGDKGDKGVQGIQGIQGKQGIQGERGLKGDKGDAFRYSDFTSEQLAQLKGAKGDQGSKGEKGNTGDKGDRGIGLQYSWSGTRLGVKRDDEPQYLYTDLKGQQGAQGIKGEPGTKGEKGDTPSIAHLETQISNKSKELDIKFESLTSKQQQDAEVINARDGEVSLNARLERDLAKGKIHFETVEGSHISTDSQEGYLRNIEIKGNTIQDANNLADIKSVGDKVEGQELYEIPLLCVGKNLFGLDDDLINDDNISNLSHATCKIISRNSLSIKHSAWVGYYNSKIKLSPNKFYTMSFEGNWGAIVRLKGKTTIETSVINTDDNTFQRRNISVESDNDGFITIEWVFRDLNRECKYNNIQLEEGTQATTYEPYQENKLTILSPVQLEKGDVLKEVDGVWGVEKNVVKHILTLDNLKSNTANTARVQFDNAKYGWGVTSFYIAGFKTKNTDVGLLDNEAYSASDGFYCKGKSIDDMVGLIALSLATTPQFIPLPHSQRVKLRTFSNKTNISFLTEIEGTIKADVPKSLGATVNTHTTQIDSLNQELDRVKKLEESTVSTVVTDKDFEVVEQTTQGYFEDVELKGKTLVNLADNPNGSYTQSMTKAYNSSNNEYKLTKTSYDFPSFGVKMLNVKADCDYTVIFSHRVNVREYDFSCGLCGIHGSYAWNVADRHFKCNTNYKTEVIKINSKDKVVDNSLGFGFSTRWWDWNGNEDVDIYIKDLIILEGDHTQNPPNGYIEGLKSVGDGTDEIVVSSVNDGSLFENASCVSGLLGEYTGAISPNASYSTSDYIEIKKGERYFLRGFNTWYSCYYDNSKNFISQIKINEDAFMAEFDGYARFSLLNTNIEKATIGFSKNSIIGKKVKTDKKKLLYFDPQDNTWKKPILDEFSTVKKGSDGVYRYYKRGEKVVLNGSEAWSKDAELTNTIRFYTTVIPTGNYSFINDKFKYVAGALQGIDEELCGRSGSGATYFEINILKSKLSTQDVAGFKAWLQANNVTVVYQLAQEQVYECTNIDLITYQNETNYAIKSGVLSPRTTLKVHSNISNIVSLLQKKVSLLESHQNNMFKMVLNGNMLGLAQCLYPEDFVAENTIQVLPYEEESDVNE